ncbi:hypothetical protein [Dactylosporangium sp. CA-092794]|uniref:hypothetical protein n=1 Tax=Dactylosporangium sp. CA-092794 TaxID=3239929 RepID=UPI003D8CA12A
MGAFADPGRFAAVPGCGVLDPATVAPVVAGAAIEADGDNCAASDGQVQITIGYTVVSAKGTAGGPRQASRLLDAAGSGTAEALAGVGDQAFRQRAQAVGAPQVITMRVSNLIVVLSAVDLSGAELPAGVGDGLVKVARAVATRLGS